MVMKRGSRTLGRIMVHAFCLNLPNATVICQEAPNLLGLAPDHDTRFEVHRSLSARSLQSIGRCSNDQVQQRSGLWRLHSPETKMAAPACWSCLLGVSPVTPLTCRSLSIAVFARVDPRCCCNDVEQLA